MDDCGGGEGGVRGQATPVSSCVVTKIEKYDRTTTTRILTCSFTAYFLRSASRSRRTYATCMQATCIASVPRLKTVMTKKDHHNIRQAVPIDRASGWPHAIKNSAYAPLGSQPHTLMYRSN